MDLSIVIVNYNVKAFLLQCLSSIYNSDTQFSYEVLVVDNASVDGSYDAVRDQFPQVRWISNPENVGFGRANNQGFELAQGTYTLILNPDTVLREDTLEVCLTYMQSHPEVGGLGIKGIDGSGQFLPESKRGLPTPLTALWKITGLSRLFPTSPIFSRYHLGHLSPEENHEVDILVGCFMMVPTDLLKKVGGFDTRYFMYGEDIDLSYELLKTGHKNVYLAESQIIHYKGESTKRGSLNYVRMFYQAMVLFAKKQFSGSTAAAYIFLIYTGIYLRASLAVLARLAKKSAAPILDAAALFAVLETTKTYWESNHRYIDGGEYPLTYTLYIQGSYVLLWLLGLWLGGTYHRHGRPGTLAGAMAISTLILGFFYGLLPEELRFSRALLLLGALGGTAALLLWRALLSLLTGIQFYARPVQRPRLLFIGTEEEYGTVQSLLGKVGIHPAYTQHCNLDLKDHECFGSEELQRVEAFVHLHRINEVIVEAGVVTNARLMELMERLPKSTSVKSYLPESGVVVGSQNSTSQGQFYDARLYQTADGSYLRAKRFADIYLSLTIWMFLPLILPVAALSNRLPGLWNWLQHTPALLIGKRTLVGYLTEDQEKFGLPKLTPPVFDITRKIPHVLQESQTRKALVEDYAKEASFRTDLLEIWHLLKSR